MCFGRAPWKRYLSRLLFVKPSATTPGSPSQHNKRQPHKTNRAERNSSALTYSWAPALGTQRCAAQQRKTSTSSQQEGELQTTQTSPDAHVRGRMPCHAEHPPTLIPLFLPRSSCHHLFSSALKTFPSSSLRQICSLYHAFVL